MAIVDISDKSKPRTVGLLNWHPPYGGQTHTALPLPRRNLVIVTDEATSPEGDVALIAARKGGPGNEWLSASLAGIAAAPLLRRATKARFLEDAACRLEKDGMSAEARPFRRAAEKHWEALKARRPVAIGQASS